MSELLRVTRAELFKLKKRPAMWVLLIAAVVLNQVFSYVIPYVSYRGGGEGPVDGASRADLLASTLPGQLVGNTISAFPVFAGALALVLGAMMFGGEYGWGTVKTLFTQRPGRAHVLGGQLLALAVAVLIGILVLFAAGAASASGIALAEGQPMAWPGAGVWLSGLAGGWLILLVWSCLGAVLGVTLRGVALPIGLGVVWVLAIENLVSAMASGVLTALQPVRDLMPGTNAGSLVSAVIPDRVLSGTPGVNSYVGETQALVTLMCYLVVCVGVAIWTASRRDVV